MQAKKNLPTTPDSGLFQRLSNVLNTAIEDLAKKTGTSRFSIEKTESFNASSLMGEELRLINMRISDMNKRLVSRENQYYKQFTAMEKAMNRYSAQSSSLFGSM